MVDKHKNNYLWMGIAVVVILTIVFMSNSNNNNNFQNEVTCNAPYIKVGTSCCLDENYNNICDTDEISEQKPVETSPEMGEPQICTKGYIDEYMCSSAYSLRKYQKEDCSYEWIKWKLCGVFPCKMENENAICDYENKYDYAKDYEFCTYSEIESLEESGLWTSHSGSYEYSDTISDRAKIGTPLLIQGSLQASYGKTENNLTDGVCGVGNAQINLKIYKDDLELFFDTIRTNQYSNWESEKFIPRENGYYKAVINWIGGNSDPE